MTVSFVGAQGAAAASVTIPAHQVGDLIVLLVYRDGSNNTPTTPTAGGTVPAWNILSSAGGSQNYSVLAHFTATATTTTSGTWTNATEILCLVYRGATVGARTVTSGSSTIITYPALTLQRTDGSSWVVGLAGHRTATNVEVAPTGMTNRTSAGTEAAAHDTNGTVTSWSNQSVTVNTSAAWRAHTLELRDKTIVLTADKGTFTLSGKDATISKVVSRTLTADTGSVAVTRNDANLYHNVRLTADVRAFTVSSVGAGVLHNAKLGSDVGKFFLPERNLITNSESVGQWTGSIGNTTVSANAAFAPDGTLTADKVIVANVTNAAVRRSQQFPAFKRGQSYVISCYVKAAELTSVAVFFNTTYTTTDYFGSAYWLNLSTGTPSNVDLNVQDVGNGWYRVWLVQTADTDGVAPSGGHSLCVTPGSTGNVNSVSGNGTDGIYVWGAQFEEGTSPSNYDPTGPAGATANDLRLTRRLVADPRSFTVASVGAGVRATHILTAETRSFTVAGNNAGLTYTPSTGRTLTADKGTFLVSGVPAGILHKQVLISVNGSLTISPVNTVVVRRTYRLVASTRAFNINGIAANVIYLGTTTGDKPLYYKHIDIEPKKSLISTAASEDQLVYYIKGFFRIL